ncbi:hypothetical protein GLYMA_10G287000v4 [Glycine max]|uniref:Uncharacterized protein n=1 Tax=Glycine max TaxID=3847 RepID=K7LM05_SOYBN|nr:hypothetical protein GYH30_029446 [Glycine max]KRH36154.1 hypothetical protein GLYMA_10G287000v4 [Glycine max]
MWFISEELQSWLAENCVVNARIHHLEHQLLQNPSYMCSVASAGSAEDCF